MQKILVTGGAGFIGSSFVRYVLDAYPELQVVNLDKLTYAGNLENLTGIDDSRYTFVHGDIAEIKDVADALTGCDAVVNFAAETHVDRAIQGASEFVQTDVRGVYNIVEAARRQGGVRVLLVSTDEVYGSILEGAFTESDPVGPRNPYSASKAGGELLGLSFFHTFGVPVIITRGSNTYGPYQYPEKILPLFVTNAIDDEPLPLYGDGRNVRDWLYVEDHCTGIDTALRKGIPGEIYNIAGGNEKENIEITLRILELTGKGEDLITRVADRPGHDRRYAIDSTKLEGLGWHPKTTWDEGMAHTVQWYVDNETWWRKIKIGEYLEYYKKQYGDR